MQDYHRGVVFVTGPPSVAARGWPHQGAAGLVHKPAWCECQSGQHQPCRGHPVGDAAARSKGRHILQLPAAGHRCEQDRLQSEMMIKCHRSPQKAGQGLPLPGQMLCMCNTPGIEPNDGGLF